MLEPVKGSANILQLAIAIILGGLLVRYCAPFFSKEKHKISFGKKLNDHVKFSYYTSFQNNIFPSQREEKFEYQVNNIKKNHHDNITIINLYGPAASGRTMIASKYFESYSSENHKGIFLFCSVKENELLSNLKNLSFKLFPEKSVEEINRDAENQDQWLSDIADSIKCYPKWLIIFDDWSEVDNGVRSNFIKKMNQGIKSHPSQDRLMIIISLNKCKIEKNDLYEDCYVEIFSFEEKEIGEVFLKSMPLAWEKIKLEPGFNGDFNWLCEEFKQRPAGLVMAKKLLQTRNQYTNDLYSINDFKKELEVKNRSGSCKDFYKIEWECFSLAFSTALSVELNQMHSIPENKHFLAEALIFLAFFPGKSIPATILRDCLSKSATKEKRDLSECIDDACGLILYDKSQDVPGKMKDTCKILKISGAIVDEYKKAILSAIGNEENKINELSLLKKFSDCYCDYTIKKLELKHKFEELYRLVELGHGLVKKIENFPNDDEVRSLIATIKIRIADCYFRRKEYFLALESLQDIKEDFKGKYENELYRLCIIKSKIYFELKNPEKALDIVGVKKEKKGFLYKNNISLYVDMLDCEFKAHVVKADDVKCGAILEAILIFSSKKFGIPEIDNNLRCLARYAISESQKMADEVKGLLRNNKEKLSIRKLVTLIANAALYFWHKETKLDMALCCEKIFEAIIDQKNLDVDFKELVDAYTGVALILLAHKNYKKSKNYFESALRASGDLLEVTEQELEKKVVGRESFNLTLVSWEVYRSSNAHFTFFGWFNGACQALSRLDQDFQFAIDAMKKYEESHELELKNSCTALIYYIAFLIENKKFSEATKQWDELKLVSNSSYKCVEVLRAIKRFDYYFQGSQSDHSADVKRVVEEIQAVGKAIQASYEKLSRSYNSSSNLRL